MFLNYIQTSYSCVLHLLFKDSNVPELHTNILLHMFLESWSAYKHATRVPFIRQWDTACSMKDTNGAIVSHSVLVTKPMHILHMSSSYSYPYILSFRLHQCNSQWCFSNTDNKIWYRAVHVQRQEIKACTCSSASCHLWWTYDVQWILIHWRKGSPDLRRRHPNVDKLRTFPIINHGDDDRLGGSTNSASCWLVSTRDGSTAKTPFCSHTRHTSSAKSFSHKVNVPHAWHLNHLCGAWRSTTVLRTTSPETSFTLLQVLTTRGVVTTSASATARRGWGDSGGTAWTAFGGGGSTPAFFAGIPLSRALSLLASSNPEGFAVATTSLAGKSLPSSLQALSFVGQFFGGNPGGTGPTSASLSCYCLTTFRASSMPTPSRASHLDSSFDTLGAGPASSQPTSPTSSATSASSAGSIGCAIMGEEAPCPWCTKCKTLVTTLSTSAILLLVLVLVAIT